MSFFRNLFGGKPEPRKQPAPPAAAPAHKPAVPPPPAPSPAAAPAGEKDVIRAFDRFGREIAIPREEWRTKVLPSTLRDNWNNPDQLYALIVDSLQHGFRAELAAAAEHLYKTDSLPTRGACVWGIILKDLGRFAEAEKVFQDVMARHGEDGSLLTNLAKVYADRKEDAKAEATLWHALEVDPNLANGMAWYAGIYNDRGGEEAAYEALRRVAALPGSWLAQARLASPALKSRNLEQALALYRESLARAPKPVPAHLLSGISGELGKHGHIPEILQLVEPHFQPDFHGMEVGQNLIHAHVDLGQLDAARRMLDQLYALKRPDWQQALSYWDTEIAKARVSTSQPDPKAPLQVTMLAIEGPVWLKPLSPGAELFPAKSPEAPLIGFLGSTAELATNSKRVQQTMTDTPGRLSRSLPLFLAEHVEFNTRTRVRTLVPWMVPQGQDGGFVLSGGPWSDEDVSGLARQGDAKCDYVVVSHLKTQTKPWQLEVRLVRTIDAKSLAQFSTPFPPAPDAAPPEFARQLLALLAEHAEVENQTPPSLYQVPTGDDLAGYFVRLEQLLAVRCSAMNGVGKNFLTNEREIIFGNLQLCLDHPANATVRLLLAATLTAMKAVRPDILPEFTDKVAWLQSQHPLPEPAQAIVQRMVNDAFAVEKPQV